MWEIASEEELLQMNYECNGRLLLFFELTPMKQMKLMKTECVEKIRFRVGWGISEFN